MKTIGFIGTGNMGGALAAAAYKSGLADRILLANRGRKKAEDLAAQVKGEVVDNQTVAKEAEYIFLGVKPQFLPEMFEGIKDILKNRKDRCIIVSMIAGTTIKSLKEMFFDLPAVRITPNIPTKTGDGFSFYTFSDDLKEEEKDYFVKLMSPSGVLVESNDTYMSSASSLTGCGPAFAAMFLEAMADGAVACGVSRKDAYKYGAMMLEGTGRYLQKTGIHPGELKDSVCSPAGSTIQGVRTLEKEGFRASIIDAYIAVNNRFK